MSVYMRCLNCYKSIDGNVYIYSIEHYGHNICIKCQRWLDRQIENTTREVVDLYFALKRKGFEPDMEKFDGHKHIDIVFERPKLHIEVDGIQHNQSTKQALSDLKRTFYSIKEGYLTIRIPNVLVKDELNETTDYLVELILERYYKHIK